MPRERKERVNGPYKHGNKWRVIWTLADGHQVVEASDTYEEAARAVADARRTVEGRTVTHALDAYEVSLRERDLAGVTITRARAHLDKLLDVDRNGHRPLGWLTPRRAAELYVGLRADTAVDTHRNGLAAGKSLGRFCAERGWLPVDPFAKVKGIGRRKKGKPQLSIDESRRLRDVCLAEQSRESIAVATSVLFGCSASEVIGRQVRDLDDGGNVLHITKGKNRFRVRSLEVPDEIRGLLLELAKGRPGSAFLFGETDLERPTRHWLYWHCHRLCKAAKVPQVSPHGLRGTHATIALGTISTSRSVAAAIAAAGAGLGHAPGSPITATTYVAAGAVPAAEQRTFLRMLKGGKR